MNNLKVSVIIPVYNTQEYLVDAINSICNQTLKEIEIITVNDGSTDKSLEILKDFESKEGRMIVYSFSKNQGPSIARNKGIELSKGEFIYFFDSDDLLEKNCLEKCYQKCISESADFLIFDGISFYENNMSQNEFCPKYIQTNFLDKNSYNGKELIEILTKKQVYSCVVWLCFINVRFLKEKGILFYPGVLYEDVLFTVLLYLHAKKVTYVNKVFFKRRIRSNSTMTSAITQKNIDYRFVVCQELLKSKKIFVDKVSIEILNLQIKNLMKYLLKNLISKQYIKLLFANSFRIASFYIQGIK